MSELKHINRKLSGLHTNLQSVERALENIQARVDRALAAEKGPDVYEQIENLYGVPFAHLTPPNGHFFLTAGLEKQEPVFRLADSSEPYMCMDCSIGMGPSRNPRLILRPAKKIVFVEDPEGEFSEHGCGVWKRYSGERSTATRYRREEAVNAG